MPPREKWADRIALGIVGLAAVVLVINLILALTVRTPEPDKIPCEEIPCTEADGACLCWSEMHYPGIEWESQ